MNKPLKSGLVFDANFEHPTCKGKSLIFIRYEMLLHLQGVNAVANS